ncbi:MAG: hypothetical protein HYR91_07325 [Flavobacteriia bacterium]|nr:hypothetical protein [Flavobacteriia bacterium]
MGTIFACTSSCKTTENKYQKIIQRIEFVFNLKKTISQNCWKHFNEKKYDVPLIYYTKKESFIANPTPLFLKQIHSKLIFSSPKIVIYKTNKRINNTEFHMETNISLHSNNKKDYELNSPFMHCSSFEITKKYVGGTNSTEYWATMVLHEYFHGFQFKNNDFLNRFSKTNLQKISEDSLCSIYKSNPWFKNKIKIENTFLLNAINTNNISKRKKLILSFLKHRQERRKIVQKKWGIQIEEIEKNYELTEGTARVIENFIATKFKTSPIDYQLQRVDSHYKAFRYFKNYKLENEDWMYLPSKHYFYATGYNLTRLLDQMCINYKSKIFQKNGKSLEDYLLN